MQNWVAIALWLSASELCYRAEHIPLSAVSLVSDLGFRRSAQRSHVLT
jgi:hypothetical protein